MYKRLIFTILPFTVMGLIFYFSSQPYGEQDMRPSLSTYLPLDLLRPLLAPVSFTYHGGEVSLATHGIDGLVEFFIRKGAHISIFFLLMITTYAAFLVNTRWNKRTAAISALVVTVLYACFDEYHQSLTPDRTPYIGDVGLDSAGALIALGVIYAGNRRRK
ncbi:VanZ family protein [Halobacillus litoralis]|uniref:VanZ family protein n=1 Tax=Halobacillus litoralis TaxID=45668 RepID=UPI001368EAA3|nr:VanZ family protein [Halobacillus litoralis]MYL36468.1 VanZ family protein [Halobacillus litoralis]